VDAVGALLEPELLVEPLVELLAADELSSEPLEVPVVVVTVDFAATVSWRASAPMVVAPTVAAAARPTVVMATLRRPISLVLTLTPLSRRLRFDRTWWSFAVTSSIEANAVRGLCPCRGLPRAISERKRPSHVAYI
jgi:hypothetical protein